MHGWRGTVLRVDLTGGRVSKEALDPRVARDYIGGRGLGVYYLNEETDPKASPFEPEERLIMATGPLTGTRAPTGARYMVVTKSPLTGSITCSNSGGRFPAELKKAGIDMIVCEGRSPEPVYLWIKDGRGELRDASHLWGKTSHATDEAVRGETDPGARVACIGPAGEKGVLFASIMNDGDRTAGRSGVGAVMGAKRLKAVAVKGDGEVPLFDPGGFSELAAAYTKGYRDSLKGEKHALHVYGTAVTIAATQSFGTLPTRNFQQGTFEGWERISGEALTRQYLTRTRACYSCPIGCGRVTRVTDPPFEGEGEGPEYETIYALGSDCGIDNLAALTKANYLCNELGLDTISMGATIASAMELFERGYVAASEIGRPLHFGDADALVELTRMTGMREGFGDLLAEGSLRLATRYGHPELAMVARGQEFAGYDPRSEQGMGLAYATSPIGASHMRGDPAYIELLGVPTLLDPLTTRDKPEIIKAWQDVFAIIDAAGLCVFFTVRNLVEQTRLIPPTGIMKLLNAATGAAYEPDELCGAGERIFNAERLFMVRAGFSRTDDTLPPRILEEPLPDGPGKGQVCRLGEMLDDYYRLRGWDENGIPTDATLERLSLCRTPADVGAR